MKPHLWILLAICLIWIAWLGWVMVNADYREPSEVLIERNEK